MANIDRNIGFRPHIGSAGTPHAYVRYPIDATNGTIFYIGDVVDHDGTGAIPAAADAGVSVIGVAVQLFDSGGIPVGHWASTESNKSLSVSTAGFVLVALALPGAIFVAQGQSGQTPVQADIGATTDHVAGGGDTVTFTSGHELDFSDLNTGAQLTIIGKVDEPLNTYDVNADMLVTFNESMFNKTSTGV